MLFQQAVLKAPNRCSVSIERLKVLITDRGVPGVAVPAEFIHDDTQHSSHHINGRALRLDVERSVGTARQSESAAHPKLKGEGLFGR